jgi:hypothetical protein
MLERRWSGPLSPNGCNRQRASLSASTGGPTCGTTRSSTSAPLREASRSTGTVWCSEAGHGGSPGTRCQGRPAVHHRGWRDNEAVNKALYHLLQPDFPFLLHIPCAAHTLQLCVKAAMMLQPVKAVVHAQSRCFSSSRPTRSCASMSGSSRLCSALVQYRYRYAMYATLAGTPSCSLLTVCSSCSSASLPSPPSSSRCSTSLRRTGDVDSSRQHSSSSSSSRMTVGRRKPRRAMRKVRSVRRKGGTMRTMSRRATGMAVRRGGSSH